MDVQTLYDFIYSLTKSYEEAIDRQSLADGFLKALSIFFPLKEIKIYMMDEYSFVLKDFIKPWENMSLSDDYVEIKKYFDDFLVQKLQYKIDKNVLYFPVVKKHKTLGIVKLISKEIIKEEDKFNTNDFFKIYPLAVSQISMLISTLKSNETVQIASKFHKTLRNIAKITETQYELEYILPIMGEMIDGFISDHLI